MRLKHFLDEARAPKIYFAHSRETYDTMVEKHSIRLIMEKFPDHIIVNPNVQWIQGKCNDGMGFDIFFKVVRTASKLAFQPLQDGRATNGTWRECEFAHKNNIPLYEVNPYKNTIKEVEFSSIKYLTAHETYLRMPPEQRCKYKENEDIKWD